jgi:hypothetical protein
MELVFIPPRIRSIFRFSQLLESGSDSEENVPLSEHSELPVYDGNEPKRID